MLIFKAVVSSSKQHVAFHSFNVAPLAELQDVKGQLVKYSLNYVRLKKPRAMVMENVAGMVSRHSPFMKKILRALSKLGYKIWWKQVNSMDFSLPHDRKRLIIVAIRNDSVKREFRWPEPSQKLIHASKLLDTIQPTDSPFVLPDKITNPRAYALVRDAILKAKSKGINIKYSEIFVDIDCSESYASNGINMIRCLTASRGASGGPWVLSRGRRLTLKEMFKFQGMIKGQDYRGCLQRPGCTERALGHMLGNTVSLPVAEAILAETLWASGLVTSKPKGRWASGFGEA